MGKLKREDLEQIVRAARARRERPNLKEADLRQTNLSKSNLSHANLHHHSPNSTHPFRHQAAFW